MTVCAAVLLLAMFSAFFCVSDGRAFAVASSLPNGYTDNVGVDGDWYFSEEYLDIKTARAMVNDLKAVYSFDALEDDPVVIAVIDTGMTYTHEIFGYGTDEDVLFRDAVGNVVARNTINGNEDVSDGATVDRHGTHVGGIVALLIRAFGLSDYIKIMPIKAGRYKTTVSGAGNYFEFFDVTEGVDFALENGADVVNLSLGASEEVPGWEKSVTEEDAEQAVFVAAAGNNGHDSDYDAFYPAANAHVIGVMNYEEREEGALIHSKSNYGSLYDVCAPGTGIFSADGNNNSEYKLMSGTSMASPIVAFAVALMQLKSRVEGEELTPVETREAFELTFKEQTEYRYADYPLLSLTGILGSDLLRDEQGNIYQSAACDAQAVCTPDVLTLGEGRTVTLSAQTGYLFTGAVFEWHYVSGGTDQTARGETVTVGIDVSEKEDIIITLVVKTLSGSPIAMREVRIATEYLVPTQENSKLTYSLRRSEDGTFLITGDKRLVLGIDTLAYASPDTEVVWYVNGRESSREFEFAFAPESDGEYVLYVTVNGERIGEDVVVKAEGVFRSDGEDPGGGTDGTDGTDKLILICAVCGGVVAFVICAAVVVALVRKRK